MKIWNIIIFKNTPNLTTNNIVLYLYYNQRIQVNCSFTSFTCKMWNEHNIFWQYIVIPFGKWSRSCITWAVNCLPRSIDSLITLKTPINARLQRWKVRWGCRGGIWCDKVRIVNVWRSTQPGADGKQTTGPAESAPENTPSPVYDRPGLPPSARWQWRVYPGGSWLI